jgi:hypothetical protein
MRLDLPDLLQVPQYVVFDTTVLNSWCFHYETLIVYRGFCYNNLNRGVFVQFTLVHFHTLQFIKYTPSLCNYNKDRV